MEHVDVLGWLLEERADLGWRDSEEVNWGGLGALGHVLWEHVLWAVHVLAELEVVDFLVVAAVVILSNHEVEHFITWWHQVEGLHDAEELLLGDVLRLAPVEVHEAGLQEDSVGDNVAVQGRHHVDHRSLLFVGEFLLSISIRYSECSKMRSVCVSDLRLTIWHFESRHFWQLERHRRPSRASR